MRLLCFVTAVPAWFCHSPFTSRHLNHPGTLCGFEWENFRCIHIRERQGHFHTNASSCALGLCRQGHRSGSGEAQCVFIFKSYTFSLKVVMKPSRHGWRMFSLTCCNTWLWVLLIFKKGRLSVSKGLPSSVAVEDHPQYLSLSWEATAASAAFTPLQMVAALGKGQTRSGST